MEYSLTIYEVYARAHADEMFNTAKVTLKQSV